MSVIDADAWSELRNTAGADFAAELAQTFAEEAPVMLAALRQARGRGDAEAFRRGAHSLKSNASTFGARRLAELARAHELQGVAAATPAALDALDAAWAEAREALQALCGG